MNNIMLQINVWIGTFWIETITIQVGKPPKNRKYYKVFSPVDINSEVKQAKGWVNKLLTLQFVWQSTLTNRVSQNERKKIFNVE